LFDTRLFIESILNETDVVFTSDEPDSIWNAVKHPTAAVSRRSARIFSIFEFPRIPTV
jgi:hypothetical protein